MARVDIPVLQCDRCKKTTSDAHEMAHWSHLTRRDVSKDEHFDLCVSCTQRFRTYMSGEPLLKETFMEVRQTPIE